MGRDLEWECVREGRYRDRENIITSGSKNVHVSPSLIFATAPGSQQSCLVCRLNYVINQHPVIFLRDDEPGELFVSMALIPGGHQGQQRMPRRVACSPMWSRGREVTRSSSSSSQLFTRQSRLRHRVYMPVFHLVSGNGHDTHRSHCFVRERGLASSSPPPEPNEQEGIDTITTL